MDNMSSLIQSHNKRTINEHHKEAVEATVGENVTKNSFVSILAQPYFVFQKMPPVYSAASPNGEKSS